MAVKSVIIRHQKTVTLSRPSAETVTNGYAVPGTPTVDTSFLAAVQPLSPKELRNLPPGQNASDWRSFWSLSEMKLKDIITAPDGNQYVIQSRIYWDDGEFWQAQGSKVHDTL